MKGTELENYNYCKSIVDELTEANERGELYEYIADALDIEFSVNARGELRGADIAVALGGPNVYIETKKHAVCLYWANERAEAHFSDELCESILSVCEALYEAVR